MKIVKVPTKGYPCDRCVNAEFMVYTPHGGDPITCPLCGGENDLFDYEGEKNDSDYCPRCNIVYGTDGKRHAVNGCTEDAMYGLIVTEFELDGKKFVGMPVFESFEEYKRLKPRLKLEMMYPGTTITCPKAYYPKNKYPQYYK